MLQLKGKETLNVVGYTVIIPSICVGNAAQLACDLLIASKKLQRVGTISHSALIPVYGPSAYQHEEEKVAACEIYESVQDKLLVIQFRTPLILRHTPDLHKVLADLVMPAKRIIILGASFGFEKRIIDASPYEYCASQKFKEAHSTQLQSVKWTDFSGDIIYGGGNSLQLFRLLEQRGATVMLLFRYLLEGDNSTDASLILSELNELCEHFLEMVGQDGGLKLIIPVSWKLLFGNEMTEILF